MEKKITETKINRMTIKAIDFGRRVVSQASEVPPLPAAVTHNLFESTSQTLMCLYCHIRTHQLSVYCQTSEFTACAAFETLGGRVFVVSGII